MPFVREPQTIGPVGRLPEEADTQARPYFLSETLPAAFRMENTLGSLRTSLADRDGNSRPIDRTYDPFKDIAGYEDQAEAFALSRDAEDTARIKRNIDRERKDRDTLNAAGWEGVAAGFAAGVIDPINLIPIGGEAYRAYRLGGSILKDGLHVARAGLLGSAASEAVLQGTQETRSAGESVRNVAGATLLAGLLGGGVGFTKGFLARRGGKTLDEIATGIEKDLDVPPPDAPDPNQPGFVRMTADDLAADTGKGSVGAAAVKETTLADEKLKSALGLEKAIKFSSPLLRAAMSRSVETRRAVQDLAETPFFYEKNALGTASPVAAETRIRMWHGPLADGLVEVKSAYAAFRSGGGKLSRGEFNVEVGKAMRRGDASAIPEVARAAKAMRESLFEPLKDEAVKLGLLPEDVKVETALSYLTRVYNVPEIIARQPEFVGRVTEWLKGQQGEVSARLDEADGLTVSTQKDIEKFDGELTIARQEEKLTNADVKKFTERRSRVARDAVAARKAVADAERQARAARERAAKLEPTPARREAGRNQRLQDKAVEAAKSRLEKAEAAVADIEKKLGEAKVAARALADKNVALQRNLEGAKVRLKKLQDRIEGDRYLGTAEEQDLQAIAEEIFHKIIGSPGGRTAYESFDIVPLNRGPLKERTFNIPDAMIEDFLESDIDTVARVYTRTMAADVELTRAFGRADMQAQLDKIKDDYTRMGREAPDDKTRDRLNKAFKKDVHDIEAMRDRIRGTYASGPGFLSPNSMMARAGRVARDWNFQRLGGMIMLSSLPDIGRPMMVHGLMRFIGDGVVPLAKNLRAVRLAGKEVRMAGTGLDMVLNSRAASAYDLGDDFGRLSKFERFSRYATDKFSIIAVIAPWNTALKQWSGVMSATRIIEESAAWRSGKINPRNAEYLAMLGIDEAKAARIAQQFGKFGETMDGVRVANTEKWTDREALLAFRAALSKDVDRIIVTPGQEKPLWMSNELGKVIGQFKAFSFASATRVLMAGLQQRDMAALNGALLSTALGTFRYVVGQWQNGKDVPDDPVKLITEGVDKAGLVGWLFDADQIMEKAVQGLGVRPLLGQPPLSRYAYRNFLSSLLGPTAGLTDDVRDALSRMMNDQPLKKTDVRAVRRLLPYQNHFMFKHLLDAAQDGVIEAIGVTN